jgi:hypothetical protein
VYGREAQHLDAHVPHAGIELQFVAAVLIGIARDLFVPLRSRNFCAGNELIGRAHRSGVIGGVEGGCD